MIWIESFLSEIGRAMGCSRPSSGRSMPSSSDSSRQPRITSAAHSVLLPEAEGAGRIAARPSRSTTAECTTTCDAERLRHQLREDSTPR